MVGLTDREGVERDDPGDADGAEQPPPAGADVGLREHRGDARAARFGEHLRGEREAKETDLPNNLQMCVIPV